ncbi:MAG TPA: ATP synthase F0 subunit C [Terriglobales bacterium]|jgi:F-type H+-transporting ATPase subunit c|nr:ATP synthase F0 subunit C [Terriglobales bacterium]
MRQVMSKVFMVMSALCFAMPAFAQGGTTGGTNWVAVAAGIAMAIASAGCGLGQGRAAAAANEGIARNPSASGAIQTALIIGLAFIESLAIYTLLIVFVKMK